MKIIKILRYSELKDKSSKAFHHSFLFFPHYIQKNPYNPLLMAAYASQFLSTNKCIHLQFLSVEY